MRATPGDLVPIIGVAPSSSYSGGCTTVRPLPGELYSSDMLQDSGSSPRSGVQLMGGAGLVGGSALYMIDKIRSKCAK